jgi:integral membrane protein
MTILFLFRLVAWFEGISFLLLLGVAMPLKYVFAMPMAVRIIGMAHGVLFIVFLILLTVVVKRYALSKSVWGWGCLAALLPAGPFIFDPYLTRRINQQNGTASPATTEVQS